MIAAPPDDEGADDHDENQGGVAVSQAVEVGASEVPVESIARSLSEQLAHEVVDRKWVAEITDRVRAVSEPLAHRIRVSELRCGSSLCRSTLVHTNPQERQNDLNELTTQEPFNTHGFVYSAGGG